MTSRKKTNSATDRLRQDYIRLKKDPVPYVVAEPLPSNILEWHYVVTGPENTPYTGGKYHGKLVFPPDFPYKPPSIYMITPNGRFKTNVRLCLSISDYHPDTWNPAWSVSTILTGLLSFMAEKSPTLGSIEMPDSERRRLAHESLDFNLKNKIFCSLFLETVEEIKEELKQRAEAASKSTSNGTTDDQIQNRSNSSLNNSNSSTGSRPELRGGGQSPLQAFITNLVIFVSVVLFGLVVQYVVTRSSG
ncbi:ubiquitin-conjugating enzyme E2 J2 [Neocloeon triangulifer]|uniref:ubiquitin-conjugating enzyme E2 J2 n=1 Tax=Neocloeon triangulifer TaxID=2078957 RepID=UPI00286F0C4D|nr:ubiquitin-conjugating enzyme E2 J2 [Neocloeon triangulifer]XP_059489539.1 ubiquitin-conjugating enzyme E2 J2 [Neocloeon triangulifer]XP_059489540.1 ubiquitin-conjugating enzyme E2 J2 [Neocloeon triangulifer]XP_059489541.1 ubiquitin-conjugating enzyme E2 J2 [Neocloeon triangulifer]